MENIAIISFLSICICAPFIYVGFLYYIPKRPWDRSPLYLIIFLLAYVILLIISNLYTYLGVSLSINHSTLTTMSSALVQIEATIFAIVVTLGIVAAELVASSYSPRVIEVYVAAKDHLLIFFIYILNLIYNLFILMLWPDKNDLFDYLIWFSFFGGVYSLLVLTIYVWNMLDYLNPSFVIERLSQMIEKESLLSYYSDGEDKDVIQPIIDIVKSSLKNNDDSIAFQGLRILKHKLIDIIRFNELEPKDIYTLVSFTQSRLSGLTIVAANSEIPVLMKLIKLNFAISFISNKKLSALVVEDSKINDKINNMNIKILESLGRISVKCGRKKEAKLTSKYLGKLGYMLEETNRRGNPAVRLTITLKDILAGSAEQNDLETVKESMNSLRIMGEWYIENNLLEAAQKVISSLKDVGLKYMDLNNKDILYEVINSLGSMCMKSLEAGKDDDADLIRNSFASLEAIISNIYQKDFDEYEVDGIDYLILSMLMYIVPKCLEKKKNNGPLRRVVSTLEIIGTRAGGVGNLDLKNNVVKFLIDIAERDNEIKEYCHASIVNINSFNPKLDPAQNYIQ